jgi:hypothetical protein
MVDGCADRTFVLMDADNFYYGHDEERLAAALRADVQTLAGLAARLAPITHLSVRLYGGWLDEGRLTQAGSKALIAMSRSEIFPLFPLSRSGSPIRGDLELATALLEEPNIRWEHTFSARPGSPQLRLAKTTLPASCTSHPQACAARALVRFTGGPASRCPVPGCTVTNSEAFETRGQKMVDAMLICDLLYASATGEVACVIVVTDDWDMLPAIVAAARQVARVVWVRRNSQRAQPYDAALRGHGVLIETWR